MIRTLCFVLAASGASLAWAQAPEFSPIDGNTLDQQRALVLAVMLDEFRGTGREAEIAQRVAGMPRQRIEQLAAQYQRRADLTAQNVQQQQEQAQLEIYRQMMIQQYAARLAAARRQGPVGFAPVVTWLPEGASLGVSAVVSPDRRYVRIGAAPFFSRVERVDTFNFHTGETRTIAGPDGRP